MSCILLTCYCITRFLHDTVYIINAVQIPTNTIFPTNAIFFKIKEAFLLCLYLFSQRFELFYPGLQIGQSVTDLSGLLSHASGSIFDAGQSPVSQLLDLDVQSCQVGVALELRCWETQGKQTQSYSFQRGQKS